MLPIAKHLAPPPTEASSPAQLAIALASLGASMEALSASAYVVRDNGTVIFSNALGRAVLAEGSIDLERIVKSSHRSEHTVTPFVAGGECLRLVIIRRAPEVEARSEQLEDRLAAARRRWRLTATQLAVLSDLASGMSNKEIAARLGRSHRTVEVHVTALLAKSTATSRSELTVKFWTLTQATQAKHAEALR